MPEVVSEVIRANHHFVIVVVRDQNYNMILLCKICIHRAFE